MRPETEDPHGASGEVRAADPAAADPIPPEARAANLRLWDTWTRVHEKAPGYDVEGFKAGLRSLTPVELRELGPLISEGTSLLHLQCHFGLDTLSCARLGADVVGLDFSGEAVALARRLADEVGLSARARFIQSDLYEADAALGGRRFEIVYVNWGAIEWLPDLGRWAAIVARHLEPGGTFYMAEIHPYAQGFEEVPGEPDVHIAHPYFHDPARPDVEPVERDYADRDVRFDDLVAYGWTHDLEEIFGSLLTAGLRLEHFHEFPFSPCPWWDWMEEDEEHLWWLPDGKGGRRSDLPVTYSLRATRPEV